MCFCNSQFSLSFLSVEYANMVLYETLGAFSGLEVVEKRGGKLYGYRSQNNKLEEVSFERLLACLLAGWAGFFLS